MVCVGDSCSCGLGNVTIPKSEQLTSLHQFTTTHYCHLLGESMFICQNAYSDDAFSPPLWFVIIQWPSIMVCHHTMALQYGLSSYNGPPVWFVIIQWPSSMVCHHTMALQYGLSSYNGPPVWFVIIQWPSSMVCHHTMTPVWIVII